MAVGNVFFGNTSVVVSHGNVSEKGDAVILHVHIYDEQHVPSYRVYAERSDGGYILVGVWCLSGSAFGGRRHCLLSLLGANSGRCGFREARAPKATERLSFLFKRRKSTRADFWNALRGQE